VPCEELLDYLEKLPRSTSCVLELLSFLLPVADAASSFRFQIHAWAKTMGLCDKAGDCVNKLLGDGGDEEDHDNNQYGFDCHVQHDFDHRF